MSSSTPIDLLAASDGTRHTLHVNRFGSAEHGKKVYVQAALHADEVPAILVAVCLKQRLQELEDAGRLRAEVVLLTSANPIGLSQFLFGYPVGRFELFSGRNFNRGFPMLADDIVKAVEGRLTDDAVTNRDLVRTTWLELLERKTPRNSFDHLQLTLMRLSVDADIVLDLHCSREASMHLYTGEAIWDQVEPLARYIGAQASLLAIDSGGQSFDEAHSLTWWQVQQGIDKRFPVQTGSAAVTVEHRGQRDVSDTLANQDAQAIVDYLTYLGMVDLPVPPLPELRHPATPLAGSEQFIAPVSGVLLHQVDEGGQVQVGDEMFVIVDPIEGTRTTIRSKTAGVFYMRRDARYVCVGDPLGRVTGLQAQRTGYLLGA